MRARLAAPGRVYAIVLIYAPLYRPLCAQFIKIHSVTYVSHLLQPFSATGQTKSSPQLCMWRAEVESYCLSFWLFFSFFQRLFAAYFNTMSIQEAQYPCANNF